MFLRHAGTPSSLRWVLRRNDDDVLLEIWANRPAILLAVVLQIIKVYLVSHVYL